MQSNTAAGIGMEKAKPHNFNVNIVASSAAAKVGNSYKVQRTNITTSHANNEVSSTNASESQHLLNNSVFNPHEGELVAGEGSNMMHTKVNDHTHDEEAIKETTGTSTTTAAAGRRGDVEALTAEVSQHHKRQLMKPVMVLILMCILNFLIYFDRGAINGALLSIQDDRKISPHGKLSDSRGGMIGSVFMFGYMFTCPLFSALNGLIPTRYIILLGMVVWCVSCVGSGLSVSYGTLLAARTFVGVGEAAIVGVTLTVIDNIAPLRSRTLWIGIFFAMMPLATAVGMFSGNIAGGRENLFHTWLASWRATFILEAIVCVPVLVLVAFLPQRYDIREHAIQLLYLKNENKKKRKENEDNKNKAANMNNGTSTKKDREQSETQPTHATAVPMQGATGEAITGGTSIQHNEVNNINHCEHDALQEESIIDTNDSGDILGSKRGISEIIKESDVNSESNEPKNHNNATAGNDADVHNRMEDNEDEEGEEDEDGVKYISFITASIEVLLNVDFDLIMLGWATYCFVVGAVSMWAIPFLKQSPLQMNSTTAALMMGAAILFSGTVGSIFGGVVIDWLTKEKKKETPNSEQDTPHPSDAAADAVASSSENQHEEQEEERTNNGTMENVEHSEHHDNIHVVSTEEEERAIERKTELAHWNGTVKAQLFDILMIVIALPMGIVALMITKIYIFVIAFFISVMAIYALTAPINAALLTVVRPAIRPHAVSYSVLFIHLLGDFPSPTLAGYFSDKFGKHCHSMSEAQCKQSAAEHCQWVKSTSEDNSVSDDENGTCESQYQIRNALALVFLVLVIAIPCWAVVYFRLRRVLRRKQLEYANQGEDNSPDSINE